MNPKYLRGWQTPFALALLCGVFIFGMIPWLIVVIAGSWYDTKWPRVRGPESGVPR